MEIAEALDRALRAAGLTIVGVSIGRRDDKATWRVAFSGKVDSAAMTTAQNVIQALDPNNLAASPDDPVKALVALLVAKGIVTSQEVGANDVLSAVIDVGS